MPALLTNDHPRRYPERKAIMGSALAARRAGNQQASKATASSVTITPASVGGSVALNNASRSATVYGSGRNNTALTTLKIAVLTPGPSARRLAQILPERLHQVLASDEEMERTSAD